ncbi:MAG: aminopeptidase P family protein [Bacteroidetes bacterium]|nr:aminopeptidase P family protein [Bacteroidota bacterium]
MRSEVPQRLTYDGDAALRERGCMRMMQRMLHDDVCDALLVTHLPHVRYLSGFTGSSGWLLLRKRSAVLLTDPRYREQAAREVRHARIHIVSGTTMTTALGHGLLRTVDRLGVEAAHLDYVTFDNLRTSLRPVRLVPMIDAVEDLRARKFPDEIAAVRRAVRISERVWHEILPLLQPGVREFEIAAEITYRQRLHGAEGDAFPPIVLFGTRTSLIHGQPSAARLRNGQPVLMDFGCRVNGYASDLTRTVFLGKASRRLREIYIAVLEAQALGRDAIRAGLPAADLDRLVRRHIEQQGFGPYFEHGLGHGLGLEVHERPSLSWRNTQPLEEGAVVTIEPGVYVPGTGGVRIEDDVLVTSDGAVTLSRLPRELMEL